MSDLISRQALLDAISDRYNQKSGKVPDNLAEGFMQMEKLIKEQPLAYDVDKVIKQLKEHEGTCTGCNNHGGDDCSWCAVQEGFDIIKRGGVNE